MTGVDFAALLLGSALFLPGQFGLRWRCAPGGCGGEL